MPDLALLRAARTLVHRHMAPTPTHHWPLLDARTGAEVWVKHENHAPTGAFKVRGGIVYLDWLRRTRPDVTGIVSATRGNHGQSLARAAAALGLSCRIYVPEGNSPEKNAAMRAFGAELVVHGADFDASRAEARRMAEAGGLHFVPSFHPELVRGVASYGLELFEAVEGIDTVYVPIGLGSGACGLIAARDALGLSTRIVGVVSTHAPATALSIAAGRVVETESARTFADGMAVRVPDPEAFAIYARGLARVVQVSDDQVAEAVRAYFTDTHNLAEGAGAAPLAALMSERAAMAGRRVALILCGANIDVPVLQEVLAGRTPVPA
ncbi:MAG: threonine dehydratase [Rhodobacteraceae bacterium]|nr:threonine dehydratase [Paracoccaceae bacterium]